eukprot:Em0005g1357a
MQKTLMVFGVKPCEMYASMSTSQFAEKFASLLKVESEEHLAKYRVNLAILRKFIKTVPQPKEKTYLQFAKWLKVTYGEEPTSAETDTIIAEDVEFQYDTQVNMLGDGVQTDIQHPNEE